MMAGVGGTVLDWAAARRRRRLERVSREAIAVQEATLRRLVATARDTEFGLAHGFSRIRSVADYQTRVPLRDYLGFARPPALASTLCIFSWIAFNVPMSKSPRPIPDWLVATTTR